MAIEVVSAPKLLSEPRYVGGAPLDKRTWWKRCDLVALKVCCLENADLEIVSASLGREPRGVADYAWRTGLKIPKEWWGALYKKNRSKGASLNLQYPYITTVRGEHADLLAVNALVPRALEEHIRADVCQEIMVDLLEGKTTIHELQTDKRLIAKYIKAFRLQNTELCGYAISLDRPLADGRSWYDVLPDPETTGEEPLRSLSDLDEWFPQVSRSYGGRDSAMPRPRSNNAYCEHNIPNWLTCKRCENAYEKTLARREAE